LSFGEIDTKPEAMFFDEDRPLRPLPAKLAIWKIQALKFAEASLRSAEENATRLEQPFQNVADWLEAFCHCQGRCLDGQVGPIAIDDQAREIVSFTVHQSAARCWRVKMELSAKVNCRGET
jgi:hypothetical protein